MRFHVVCSCFISLGKTLLILQLYVKVGEEEEEECVSGCSEILMWCCRSDQTTVVKNSRQRHFFNRPKIPKSVHICNSLAKLMIK